MESSVGVNPLVVAAVVANAQLLNLQRERSCENSIDGEEEKDSSDEGVETLEFEGTPVAVWNRRIVEGWDVDPAALSKYIEWSNCNKADGRTVFASFLEEVNESESQVIELEKQRGEELFRATFGTGMESEDEDEYIDAAEEAEGVADTDDEAASIRESRLRSRRRKRLRGMGGSKMHVKSFFSLVEASLFVELKDVFQAPPLLIVKSEPACDAWGNQYMYKRYVCAVEDCGYFATLHRRGLEWKVYWSCHSSSSCSRKEYKRGKLC
jgi:hypothetical protein